MSKRITRKSPDKGSFSKKNSSRTSGKTGRESSFEKKSSFPKKKDSANDKSKTFSKSKKSDFSKKPEDKNSSFEKKHPFPKKRDFTSRKEQSFSENKRTIRKIDSDKNSSFREKPFTKNKDFTPGKGKSFPENKTSGFTKKGFFEKSPSFTKKRKDIAGKGKPFSKNKSSDFIKKESSKDSEKKFRTPNYTPAKSQGTKKTIFSSPDDPIRLNRYIANSGVCSRREADELISLGEISVNGNIITELGFKVNRNDVVKYNNRTLTPEKFVYLLLNKPKDFITTTEDPQDRRTVMALVENACKERVYPVGRLDRNTTGLLLLTNDGQLAKKLTHPSSNVKKLYQVDLNKPLLREDFEKILDGLELEDGPVHVDALAFVSQDKSSIGIEIHEGRNRIVRRIFEHLGYEVVKLDRVMYAGLTKKDLPRGKWKFLTEKEVIQLKHFL